MAMRSLLVAVLTVFVAACAAPETMTETSGTFDDVPLPDDLRVVAPADDVEPRKAAYSGAWAGVWEHRLNHILVVEEIGPSGATVVGAWGHGAMMQGRAQPGGWTRHSAEFVDGALKLRLPLDGATATYRLQQDGSLDAVYESARGTSHATLKRIEL